MGVKVNSKKLNRIVERAKKRDYAKFVRRKRIITITSAAILASGAVGGIVYGFWFLSQKSTKPAFVALPSDSNDLILGDAPFCGNVKQDGSPSFSCYSGKVRVNSAYPKLITSDRVLEIAKWLKSNINRGAEASVLEGINFVPGVDSTAGITLAYRSGNRSKVTILMSPDAQDWTEAYASKALEEQAVLKFASDANKAASNFLTVLKSIFAADTGDASIPRTPSGEVDIKNDEARALYGLMVGSSSLAGWEKDFSSDSFLKNVYKLLFRSYYYDSPAKTIDLANRSYDYLKADTKGTLYDRALVSTIMNANDPLFKNGERTLFDYYSSKGIDFSKDVLGSLRKLNDIHSDLMQGSNPVTKISNSELSKSLFVKSANLLFKYIEAHPKIGSEDSASLVQPLFKFLFQNPVLAKSAFANYADLSGDGRTSGANADVAPGVSTLQPLLFSNYDGFASRFVNAAKPGIPPLSVLVTTDTVSYNVNNPEVMSFSPSARDLGETISTGKWFQDDIFYKDFNEDLYRKLFSDMAYTISHEYGHHYTIWNTQNGETEDQINVFNPKSMTARNTNKPAWNALLEAETSGGNLDNLNSLPPGVNTLALKNLIMASDASSATTATTLIAADTTESLSLFANVFGQKPSNGFLSNLTSETYMAIVLSKGGQGVIGTDIFYVDYVRSLVDLIYKKYYGSNWLADDRISISSSESALFAPMPLSFDDYLNFLYPKASPEKQAVSILIGDLSKELEKSEESISFNRIGNLATNITHRVYNDASNNVISEPVSSDLPSLVKQAKTVPLTFLYKGAKLTKNQSITTSPLMDSFQGFVDQKKSPGNTLIFGEPFLAAKATTLGFLPAGTSAYDGVFADYVLSYEENLTRIWQVLTLPVDERANAKDRNGQLFVSRLDTEKDNAYLRALGIYIYDETTGLLTEVGKDLVDFYRSISGLVVDTVTHKVVDAQELHQFNRLANNEQTEISGWIKSEDASKLKGVQFKNLRTGEVSTAKAYVKNVASNHYYSKIYQDNDLGEYFRDPASRESDFSGDYVQWQSDYISVGNYSNVALQEGDYSLSFIFEEDSKSETKAVTKMLNDSKFNSLAVDGKTLNPNSFSDFFSNFYFVLSGEQVVLHVRERVT